MGQPYPELFAALLGITSIRMLVTNLRRPHDVPPPETDARLSMAALPRPER